MTVRRFKNWLRKRLADFLVPDHPRLKPYRLRQGYIENQPEYMKDIPGLNFKDRYLILGEVGEIHHYIMMNMSTGQVLPGMFHLERFEEVPEDEI
jgi:hypothetical protein